jgi:hypothetical protein
MDVMCYEIRTHKKAVLLKLKWRLRPSLFSNYTDPQNLRSIEKHLARIPLDLQINFVF